MWTTDIFEARQDITDLRSHDPAIPRSYDPVDRSSNGHTDAYRPQGRYFRQVFPLFAAAPYRRMCGMPYRCSTEACRYTFSEEPQSDDEVRSDGHPAVRRRIGRYSLRRFGCYIPGPRRPAVQYDRSAVRRFAVLGDGGRRAAMQACYGDDTDDQGTLRGGARLA
jgi:hypothetical protein